MYLKTKEVLELKYDEVQEKVQYYLNANFATEDVLSDIDIIISTGNDIYVDYSRDLVSVMGTVVPDSAGRYLEKEFIEIFGFEVDEDYYLDNHHEYITFVESVLMDYIDKWIDKNINEDLADGIEYKIDYYSGEILEILYVDPDFVPEEVKGKFIGGTDMNLMTNINEGYVSCFKNDFDNEIFVYTVYDVDADVYYYDSIPAQTEEDMLIDYDPEELSDDLISCCDLKREDLYEQYKTRLGRMHMLQDNQFYYGEPFTNIKKADNHLQIFNDLYLI